MNQETQLSYATIDGEDYFKISNHDRMAPFFMSIVSDGNHWLFVSSNGGLTAGRKNAEFSLFPYYTDDKLGEMVDTAGPKTVFRVAGQSGDSVWEPFSIRDAGKYKCSRNLYKGVYGNKIIFEEENHDLGLSFSYQWSSSNSYGLVRTSCLTNKSDASTQVTILDGLQNIVPAGINSLLQNTYSNLADAYKRTELDPATGLGIYALSSIIADRAEPNEALRANTIWSSGLEQPLYLLSSTQLDTFRKGGTLQQEEDVKAKKGAYFVSQQLELGSGEAKDWSIVANVNQDASAVVELVEKLSGDKGALMAELRTDIAQGTDNLKQLVSAADGFQLTADRRRTARHYSNAMFNIMRGGIFDDGYTIEKGDFTSYLKKANHLVYEANASVLESLPDCFSLAELKQQLAGVDDFAFERLATEYLPLKFSRRHGDPSRPWNRFSINTRSEVDGSKILDYEGNWRDIFQNWEALAQAYPDFIDGMIFRFLNASTFDGYNPYRVTKGGFDWEVIDESDPWSYIGYWGDHQIIYLLKFLEFSQAHFPGRLQEQFSKEAFVYANVPYRIKAYAEILKNPKDTILFDEASDTKVRAKRDELGADGALLENAAGEIHRVNFMEKLLATMLAKLSNFIPEGGIWMNTQRPEWNDANNALVGNGISMVTLCYLRRFLSFLQPLAASEESYEISAELKSFFDAIQKTLSTHEPLLVGSLSDEQRKAVVDGLGIAGSDYRDTIYDNGFSGQRTVLSGEELTAFIGLGLRFLEHSIEANRRPDGMYHAYNLLSVTGDGITVDYLYEMLEGQVAVLSSGYLTAEQSLALLDALKNSSIYRQDQGSYILYPDKQLPGFLQRNIIPEARVKDSKLLQQLLADGNQQVLKQDVRGNYHFASGFNNVGLMETALDDLSPDYDALVASERELVLGIYEEVFNHKAFTGRSGTFYGYEGLGSIYWHMVSKLLLAVQEICEQAIGAGEPESLVGRLQAHYDDILEGIGVNKTPEHYGAFPTDPYSHTPSSKGAQQPGMTGQVKEDFLTRMGELGVSVEEGRIQFAPSLLKAGEFLTEAEDFVFTGLDGAEQVVPLEAASLAFTCCQVPIVYRIADSNSLAVHLADGSVSESDGLELDVSVSSKVFHRSGEVSRIVVNLSKDMLR